MAKRTKQPAYLKTNLAEMAYEKRLSMVHAASAAIQQESIVAKLLDSNCRNLLCWSVLNAMTQVQGAYPGEKPNYYRVKALVDSDADLKGALPFLFLVVIGWIIQKILDYIWNNL